VLGHVLSYTNCNVENLDFSWISGGFPGFSWVSVQIHGFFQAMKKISIFMGFSCFHGCVRTLNGSCH
jgi:hypothetical protein